MSDNEPKPRKFMDCLEEPMSSSNFVGLTSWILLLLKAAGELQNITWTFIIVLFVVAFALRTGKAFIKWAATGQEDRHQPARQPPPRSDRPNPAT